jgi:hypothetical protein
MTPKQLLRHHVTGAIERGEAAPIVEVRFTNYRSLHLNRVGYLQSVTLDLGKDRAHEDLDEGFCSGGFAHSLGADMSSELSLGKYEMFVGTCYCLDRP